jgi:hypothetical protein
MQSLSITTSQNRPLPDTAYRLEIDRTDRWCIYHRLQELNLPCWCLPDGSLWVDVLSCSAALLVRSVVLQMLAPRTELVDWLERCQVCKVRPIGIQD